MDSREDKEGESGEEWEGRKEGREEGNGEKGRKTRRKKKENEGMGGKEKVRRKWRSVDSISSTFGWRRELRVGE